MKPSRVYRHLPSAVAVWPPVLGALVAAYSLLAALTWTVDLDLPPGLLPSPYAQSPGAAVGLLGLGMALFLLPIRPGGARRSVVANICAALAITIGAATAVGYAFHTSLGFYTWLHMPPEALSHVARTPGITAGALVLAGMGVALLPHRRMGSAVQALALATFSVGLFDLVLMTYGGWSRLATAELQLASPGAAACLCVISVGILMSKPEAGIVGLLRTQDAGGAIARRLLPAVLLVPFLFGLLREAGTRVGLVDVAEGTALVAIGNMSILAWLTWLLANGISTARRDRADLEALHEIATQSSGLLNPFVLGRLVVSRACNLLGGGNALLVWWDPIKNSLGVLADNHVKPIGGPIAVDEGSAGLAFQRGEPVVVEDYPNWEHALPDMLSRGNKSVVAVPLRVRDQPVGALTVAFTRRRQLTKKELRLLTLLAAQEAPALEAAMLHTALLAARDYQGLFENSPDPMWVADAESLAILAVNQHAIERYGYSREEFLALTAKELRPPEEVPAYVEAMSTLPPDALRSSSTVHRAKDGSTFEVEVTSKPSVFGERQVRIVSAQDVSEKRRRAEQLGQSQRLESLGELAGGIAHDFNNLLGVILNFDLFVKEKVAAAAAGPEGERWQPVLKDVLRIERAAESAARLTHQLLAFARREVVQARPLDITAAVRELEPLLRRTLGEYIEFVTAFAADAHTVLMDPGQLDQVLANLAVNARDAMREGGTLTIATRTVEVDQAYAGGRPGLRPGRYVELQVSDTGAGMSAETARRAFEPFFTTKPTGQGTGLGLATVYGIVTQAGGHVSLYSELGRGTRVHVLLPATDQSPSASEPPESELASSPQEARTETILVVEDNEDLREVVGRILGRAGYQVISAAGGPEALEAARAHAGGIDLLLTDVVMPKMQGKELAQRLAATRPGLRVLYMSGYAQPSLGPQRSLEPGVVLIEKPFTEPALLAKLRGVLEARP